MKVTPGRGTAKRVAAEAAEALAAIASGEIEEVALEDVRELGVKAVGRRVRVPSAGEVAAAAPDVDAAWNLVVALVGLVNLDVLAYWKLRENAAVAAENGFGQSSQRTSSLGRGLSDGADGAEGTDGADLAGDAPKGADDASADAVPGDASGDGEVAGVAGDASGAGEVAGVAGDASGAGEVAGDSGEDKGAAGDAGDAGEGTDAAGDAGDAGEGTDAAGDAGEDKGAEGDDGGKRGPKKGKGSRSKSTARLPRAEVTKTIPEEELERLRRSGTLRRLPDGKYTTIVPITTCVQVTVRFERQRDDERGVTYAADSAGDSRPVPRSDVSASLEALHLYMRYGLALPATRVCDWLRQMSGLELTRQRLYFHGSQLGLSLARPLCQRMLELALATGLLQSDESWCKVREDLRDGRTNSVVWQLRTSEADDGPQIVTLSYTGTREAKALAALIRGFKGSLMADCYQAYPAAVELENLAESVVVVACLQHSRSNFCDVAKALRASPAFGRMDREAWDGLDVNRVIALYGEVFGAEREMPRGKEGESREDVGRARARHRAEEVRPALDRLYELVERLHAKLRKEDGGKMAEALRYAVKYKDRFYAAADNPWIPLTNSACEREFAFFGVLRANSRQFDTVLGAATACMWFSIERTARANGGDVPCYLEFLLTEGIAELKAHGDWWWYGSKGVKGGWDEIELAKYGDLKYLDELMPWSERFKRYAAGWAAERDEIARKVAEGLALAV